MTTSLATKPREYYIVFVKTKRARIWHPLEIFSKRSHARHKIEELKEKWPWMDCRVSIMEEA